MERSFHGSDDYMRAENKVRTFRPRPTVFEIQKRDLEQRLRELTLKIDVGKLLDQNPENAKQKLPDLVRGNVTADAWVVDRLKSDHSSEAAQVLATVIFEVVPEARSRLIEALIASALSGPGIGETSVECLTRLAVDHGAKLDQASRQRILDTLAKLADNDALSDGLAIAICQTLASLPGTESRAAVVKLVRKKMMQSQAVRSFGQQAIDALFPAPNVPECHTFQNDIEGIASDATRTCPFCSGELRSVARAHLCKN